MKTLMVIFGLILSGIAHANAGVTPIDTNNSEAVKNAYLTWKLAPLPNFPDRSDNDESCEPLKTSLEFQQRVIDQVNFYRAMTGLSSVKLSFDSRAYSQMARMITVNEQISHSPSSDWKCFSAGAAQAAGHSNLSNSFGPYAIDDYMADFGEFNTEVGHRRWVLYQPQVAMATGDDVGSNVLGVMVDHSGNPKQRPFVAWPSAGYFPASLLPDWGRWSISVPDADFSQARVSVRDITRNLDMQITLFPTSNGYGDNTLVWTIYPAALPGESREIEYVVKVSGIRGAGQPSEINYSIKTFPIVE